MFTASGQDFEYNGISVCVVSVDVPSDVMEADTEKQYARTAAFKFFERIIYTFEEKTGIPSSYLSNSRSSKIATNDSAGGKDGEIFQEYPKKTLHNVVTPQFKRKKIYCSSEESSSDSSDSEDMMNPLEILEKRRAEGALITSSTDHSNLKEININQSKIDEVGKKKEKKEIKKSYQSYLRNQDLFITY